MTTKDEALTCIDDDGDDRGHRCGQCDDYVDRNGHVRAAIREACAKACEETRIVKGGEVFAAKIRARGNT